jgi:hypothetical protein
MLSGQAVGLRAARFLAAQKTLGRSNNSKLTISN